MIKSFADSQTEKVFGRDYAKKLPDDIQRRAYKKLLAVDVADEVSDLRHPPGNRLKKFKGAREGPGWSIRTGQQWRVCFQWERGDAYDVEIVDYH